MIQMIDVTKTHINSRNSSVEALKGLTLNLPAKGLVLLVGNNGSGKSTLLSILGGLDTVTSGKYIVDGLELSGLSQGQLDTWRSQEISFVFQNYNLLGDYTVEQNIKLGSGLSGNSCDDKQIKQVLKLVHLEGFEKRYPRDLSGGERQKVAVARALIKNPRSLFVDEPTTQTDDESTESLLKLFKQVSAEMLVVFVSHDTAKTLKLADRVIELKKGLIVRDEIISKKQGKDEGLSRSITQSRGAVTSQFEIAVGLGMKNFIRHPLKTAATIAISLFALVLFSTTIMLAGYNRWQVLAADATSIDMDFYVFTSETISLQTQIDFENRIGVSVYPYYSFNFSPQISGGMLEMPHSYGGDEVLLTDYLVDMLFLLDGKWNGFDLAPVTTTSSINALTAEEQQHILLNQFLVATVAPGFVSRNLSNVKTVTKLFLPVQSITASELEHIIEIAETKYDLRLESPRAASISNFSDDLKLFEKTFLVIGIIALLIAAISLYTFASNMVVDKKRDIGILRSLGARATTIFSLFITTIGFISASTFILSAGAAFIVMAVLNTMVSGIVGYTISAVTMGIGNFLVLLCVCELVSFTATFIPIYKYSKQSPAMQIKR